MEETSTQSEDYINLKKFTSILILFLFIIATILVIFLIQNYTNKNFKFTEDTMNCIANNSILIIKEGCQACAKQEEELGEYLDNFKIINIIDNPEILEEYDFQAVPTWIVNYHPTSRVAS